MLPLPILLALALSTARADNCKPIESASKNVVMVDGVPLNLFRDTDRAVFARAVDACNKEKTSAALSEFDEHYTKARRRVAIGAYAGVSGRPLISAFTFTFASIRAIRANRALKQISATID